VTYDAHIREKARQLRVEKRLTIDAIAERLAVSRTTVYYWVRDLPPVPRKSSPGQRLGNVAMQQRYRAIREAAYDLGRSEFDDLAGDPTFRDFVCMYIGEGYKRCRNTVSIANSDPAVVSLGARWIRRFARNPLFFSIQYHADQDLEQLRTFWAQELGIPPELIRLQRKSNSGGLKGRTWRCAHGVMTVGANDTSLRSRLQGWIDRLQESWVESRSLGA
jgi:AcrR family transcriptional regulator